MKVGKILHALEAFAPLYYQDAWDNAGLIIGDPGMEVSGILVSLDVTKEVLREAVTNGCNLIVSHHPLLFNGLKKFTPEHPEYLLIREAVMREIAVISMHTNLDNQWNGINKALANGLGLKEIKVLKPQRGKLKKLVTFSPVNYAMEIRQALFASGAGTIGNYDCCSFSVAGQGTFRGSAETHPFVGKREELHTEDEVRVEMVFPGYLEKRIVEHLLASHPYEEVAYDIYPLENGLPHVGAGIIGRMEKPWTKTDFLTLVKRYFHLDCLRHSICQTKVISVVALCSGSGASLIPDVMKAGADIYLTGDLKYHTYQSEGREILLADIGHFESELVVKQLLYTILKEKFPNFAVLISKREKNPIIYL